MNLSNALLLQRGHHLPPSLIPQTTPPRPFHSPSPYPTRRLIPSIPLHSKFKHLKYYHNRCRSRYNPGRVRVSGVEARVWVNAGEEEEEDLAEDGVVYKKTLRLVECSMFAAVSGLAYFLSNSLAVENYFGCFFALPIVISSMRWGIAAGRKTMVATAMLLLVLSGPVKALTYLLMHGVVGLTMGTLWRLGTSWGLSIVLCALVRALGACGYVLVSSFLISENILALITINIHASLTFIFTSLGINAIPSMNAIYAIFGSLLMLNCGFFVFLLHILYAVLFVRLGMKSSLSLPRWLEKAI